jgi:hypothetical protein
MNDKLGLLVSRERLVLDGIAYNINVHAKDRIYRAVWLCGACSERSKLAFEHEHATVQAAIDACKLGLAGHHTKAHTLT